MTLATTKLTITAPFTTSVQSSPETPLLTVKDFYNSFNFREMVHGNLKGKPPILLQQFFELDLKYIHTNLEANKEVLEVGCGFGRLLPELSKLSRNVTGIDFSDLQLSQAQEIVANLKNVQLLKMRAESMAFRSESFALSLCMNCTLGNMPNIEKTVVEEMVRVTKSGGKVIIRIFADTEAVRLAQYENYNRLGLTNIRDNGSAITTDEGFYSRRFNKTELQELFKKTGLTPTITSDCEAGYLVVANI